MKSSSVWLVLIGLWLSQSVVCSPIYADVLWVDDSPVQLTDGNRTIGGIAQFNPRFHFFPLGVTTPTLASIFSGVTINMSEIGQVFTATPSNDPGFAQFASLLTDGTNEYLEVQRSPYVAVASGESSYFRNQPGGNGIDLQGFEIDSISYEVTGWYYVSPGRNPNRDGIWTDTYFGSNMEIDGHAVPEPSTLALLAIGTFGLAAYAWRKRRRSLRFSTDPMLPSEDEADSQATAPAVLSLRSRWTQSTRRAA